MSKPPKRRPTQRVDLGASSGPASWLDDSALVRSLREQLAARTALAADPGQGAERERLLEVEHMAALQRIAAYEESMDATSDVAHQRHMAFLNADADWCLAVIAVASLVTPTSEPEELPKRLLSAVRGLRAHRGGARIPQGDRLHPPY